MQLGPITEAKILTVQNRTAKLLTNAIFTAIMFNPLNNTKNGFSG